MPEVNPEREYDEMIFIEIQKVRSRLTFDQQQNRWYLIKIIYDFIRNRTRKRVFGTYESQLDDLCYEAYRLLLPENKKNIDQVLINRLPDNAKARLSSLLKHVNQENLRDSLFVPVYLADRFVKRGDGSVLLHV